MPGGGGGGAGGTVYLAANAVIDASGSVVAVGGEGGTGSEAGNSPYLAGDGGVGSIRLWTDLAFSTDPAAYTTCP